MRKAGPTSPAFHLGYLSLTPSLLRINAAHVKIPAYNIVVQQEGSATLSNDSKASWIFSPPESCYLSCDPATLARDLKKLLSGGYVIGSVLGVEMFPQTHHVKTVVRLARRRGAKPLVLLKVVDLRAAFGLITPTELTYHRMATFACR
jgi:hypothetical protein